MLDVTGMSDAGRICSKSASWKVMTDERGISVFLQYTSKYVSYIASLLNRR